MNVLFNHFSEGANIQTSALSNVNLSKIMRAQTDSVMGQPGDRAELTRGEANQIIIVFLQGL